jgi:hypothetical protein
MFLDPEDENSMFLRSVGKLDHINGHRMLEDSTVVFKPRILRGERQYVSHVNAIQLAWLFVRMCVYGVSNSGSLSRFKRKSF